MTEQFSTESGARATLYPAEGQTIVVLPAMGVPAAKYERFAVAAQDKGLFVVPVDCPGQAGGIDRSSTVGYHDLARAIGEVADEMRRRRPGSPLYLVGHSLGGHVSAVLESTRPGAFDALVLAASGTNHWRRFPLAGMHTVLLFPTLFELKARLRGYFDGRSAGFGVQATRTISDWARMSRTGSWGPHERSARKFPVLAVSFVGDTYAPESATAALCEEFPRADVTKVRISERQGHVGWLRDPSFLIAEMTAWFERIEAPAAR